MPCRIGRISAYRGRAYSLNMLHANPEETVLYRALEAELETIPVRQQERG